MYKAMLAALMVFTLAGCAQQTPAEFGKEVGRDYVLKDDQSMCNAVGWYYWTWKESPRPGERQQAAATLDILKRELVARHLKGNAMCEMAMKNGQAEAKNHNAESVDYLKRQAEQQQREARAASY